MKQIKIKGLLKKDLLVVELPEGARDFKLFADLGRPYISYFHGKCETGRYYFDGDCWEFLGKVDEIRDEDAAELVQSWKSVAQDGTSVYENYLDSIPKKRSATESLLSAIETVVFWKNPIPVPEIQGGYDEFGNSHGGLDDNWISEYESHESRTFDRTRTLIFVKN